MFDCLIPENVLVYIFFYNILRQIKKIDKMDSPEIIKEVLVKCNSGLSGKKEFHVGINLNALLWSAGIMKISEKS